MLLWDLVMCGSLRSQSSTPLRSMTFSASRGSLLTLSTTPFVIITFIHSPDLTRLWKLNNCWIFNLYNILQFHCSCVKTRSTMLAFVQLELYPFSLQQIGTHISSLAHAGKLPIETYFDCIFIRKLMKFILTFHFALTLKVVKVVSFEHIYIAEVVLQILKFT